MGALRRSAQERTTAALLRIYRADRQNNGATPASRSLVLVDTEMREIEVEEWTCEHDRPMYLVDVRDGYRCGWFHPVPGRLFMEPHPLSRCAPESWALPTEAEVVGKVIGVVSRLNEPWSSPLAEFQAEHAGSKRRAP